MNTIAVVLKEPQQLEIARVGLSPQGDADVTVDIEWSGISTGTERLLWSGRMPSFPGMGYPLVPGYESVGRISAKGTNTRLTEGQRVFVPGAQCFREVRGLFGGAAKRLIVPETRVIPIEEELGEQGVLLALAATAYHAISGGDRRPDLIIGHGVLGRLLARLSLKNDEAPPTVWELNPIRSTGNEGYPVLHPDADPRRDYRAIYDVSGDSALIDTLVQRLAPGGEIVLAGFYADPISFQFPPAFMREARFRIAAQWQPADLTAVGHLVAAGQLKLNDLITHRQNAEDAPEAYRTAFTDSACLKMILDWRNCS